MNRGGGEAGGKRSSLPWLGVLLFVKVLVGQFFHMGVGLRSDL